jgi:iron-sulfur cluster assembly protein CyaY
MSPPALDSAEYEALALPELKAVLEALDGLEEDGIDAELSSDILTIEFSDGQRYVLNSHSAARQIWLAAERSAWHFDWDPEARHWIAQKSSEELWATLEGLLQHKLGHAVRLVAP